MRRNFTSKNVESPSVDLVNERLDELRMKRIEFARRLEVSPEYVYRILNRRVAFPGIRETLEKMANILGIAPSNFPEYVRFEEALSPSALKIWQHMREQGLTREDLFKRMEGRISRPYFYGILRGDHPFPMNRAFIQVFATALGIDPTVFPEYTSSREPRWAESDMRELEVRFLNLLFDKMLSDYGYTDERLVFDLTFPDLMAVIPKKKDLASELEPILARMGHWGIGIPELAKVSGVGEHILRLIFFNQITLQSVPEALQAVRYALQLDGEFSLTS